VQAEVWVKEEVVKVWFLPQMDLGYCQHLEDCEL
jgi:hypothetical protein